MHRLTRFTPHVFVLTLTLSTLNAALVIAGAL